MGWAGGSELMNEVIGVLKKHVTDADVRVAAYAGLIRAFQNHDCDTLDECEGRDAAFDAALNPRRKRKTRSGRAGGGS
jgi:putative N-acetylmannosamine-6-phosphate epimerase